MKDQVTVRFPDQSQQDCLLHLTETDLTLGEVSIELAEINSCAPADATCVLTASGQTYSLTFGTEKRRERFVTVLEANLEELGAELKVILPKKKKSDNPKKRTTTTILIILAAVLVLAAIAVGLYLWNENRIVPAYGENDVTVRESYGVAEADPNSKEMKRVIAINADGDPVLTNSVLQVYYWMEYGSFMNYAGSYASMYGLNAAAPLSTQIVPMDTRTWEQYFLDFAVQSFQSNYALSRAALADGYTLNEESVAMLNGILSEDGELNTQAVENGYANGEEYIRANFGHGTNLQAYYDYYEMYLTASGYYEDVLYANAAAGVTDADIEEYFDTYAEDYGDIKYNNVSARHILIIPEGETDATTGTWSDEAWADAKAKAEEVLALWQEDPTVKNFEALVTEYSEDEGSVEAGGLYENFAPGEMVTEFNDWCFDTKRQSGDVEIVKTLYGYHIIYFVEQTETRNWFNTAKNDMLSERLGEVMTGLMEEYPVQIDFNQIRLYDIISASLALQ